MKKDSFTEKNITIEELLNKRDFLKSLSHLHSGPYGLTTYREHYERKIEAIDRKIKEMTKGKGE